MLPSRTDTSQTGLADNQVSLLGMKLALRENEKGYKINM